MQVLLIHPPVAKPGEPPAGVARLKGALDRHGITCKMIDANLEGMLHLLKTDFFPSDRWTRQAFKQKDRDLEALRNGTAFTSIDHYNRLTGNLNRLLNMHGREDGFHLGLADCTHESFSTARSEDLIRHAEKPEINPFFQYYRTVLIPQIEKESPEMVGLSVNFISQALCAFALIGCIRKQFPDVKIVLGGGLITSWMRNGLWRDPFTGWVDACIEGPGEAPLLSLLGIDRDSDSPALPQYDDLFHSDYLSPGFVLPYNTSTGCYWRKCRFCPELAEESIYHPLPVSQVQKELHRLSSQRTPSLIHYLDSALSPSFLKFLMDHPPVAPWYGYVRFTEHLADSEYCRALKRSGCVMLKLGLESGNPSVLEHMQKGIDLGLVARILKNLKEVGISTFVYLLFGTPTESETEAEHTLNFVVNHQKEIGYINPAIFNMPITSIETADYPHQLFSEGDLSLYVRFEHPKGWDRQQVRRFLNRRFSRHPAVAAILRRTPKFFTSNHAPFFA